VNFEVVLGSGMVIAIVTAVYGYGRLSRSVENNQDEVGKLWDAKKKLLSWQDDHDRESSEKRLEFEREIGRVRETIIIRDGKLDNIIQQLSELNKKVDRLENRDGNG